jgi:lipopolysaccharide export system protein LptA
MVRTSVLLAAVAALLSLASAPPVANSSPNTTAANTQENPKSTQVFTGTIVESSGKYLLDDTANKVTYELDDAKKASVFVGKRVRVTGTLDATNKLIHVESIEEAT